LENQKENIFGNILMGGRRNLMGVQSSCQ